MTRAALNEHRLNVIVQWPHAWDQPLIANQMDYLGVAIELLQVRNGERCFWHESDLARLGATTA